ncbi:hypothetical protein K439DRAFT_1274602, partial [Ramaria rubella]
YLHKFNRVDSPLCPACNNTEETVHHFLMICPAYAKHRRVMARALPRDSTPLSKLLAHSKALPHLFKFVNATARFKSTLG